MRLIVRADGARSIGLGHVMRSLAIAQEAAAAGADVSYVMLDDDVACALPERRGFEVQRVTQPDDRRWLDGIGPDNWVMFDGYSFLKSGITGDARARGAHVVVVDDHDGGSVEADIVVNPNAVDPAGYPGARQALCGPRYALVRSEFMPYRRARTGEAGTLLVTLGGSDASGATEPVLDALDAHRDFARVVLVVGPAAPATRPRPWLEVVRDPDDVAAAFDLADAALSAAGSTTWELLCLGVPCALVEVAPNQRMVAMTVARAGAAFVASSVAGVATAVRNLANPYVQARLSERALATVDGLGAKRVVAALASP
jgi:spore coat polysaccharide biosynthesis predicted glycosyltransferase SpsG